MPKKSTAAAGGQVGGGGGAPEQAKVYATFDPARTHADITLSADNTRATASVIGQTTHLTHDKADGWWAYELTPVDGSATLRAGITDDPSDLTADYGSQVDSVAYYASLGREYKNGTFIGTPWDATTGKILIVIDAAGQRIGTVKAGALVMSSTMWDVNPGIASLTTGATLLSLDAIDLNAGQEAFDPTHESILAAYEQANEVTINRGLYGTLDLTREYLFNEASGAILADSIGGMDGTHVSPYPVVVLGVEGNARRYNIPAAINRTSFPAFCTWGEAWSFAIDAKVATGYLDKGSILDAWVSVKTAFSLSMRTGDKLEITFQSKTRLIVADVSYASYLDKFATIAVTHDGTGLAAGLSLYIDRVKQVLNVTSDTAVPKSEGTNTVWLGRNTYWGVDLGCTLDRFRGAAGKCWTQAEVGLLAAPIAPVYSKVDHVCNGAEFQTTIEAGLLAPEVRGMTVDYTIDAVTASINGLMPVNIQANGGYQDELVLAHYTQATKEFIYGYYPSSASFQYCNAPGIKNTDILGAGQVRITIKFGPSGGSVYKDGVEVFSSLNPWSRVFITDPLDIYLGGWQALSQYDITNGAMSISIYDGEYTPAELEAPVLSI